MKQTHAILRGWMLLMLATPALAQSFASNLFLWCGGLLGITIVLGLVGLFVGKASE